MPCAMAMPRDGQRELASWGYQAELGNQRKVTVLAMTLVIWFPSSAWEPGLGSSCFLSVRGWDAIRHGHAPRRPAGTGKPGFPSWSLGTRGAINNA